MHWHHTISQCLTPQVVRLKCVKLMSKTGMRLPPHHMISDCCTTFVCHITVNNPAQQDFMGMSCTKFRSDPIYLKVHIAWLPFGMSTLSVSLSYPVLWHIYTSKSWVYIYSTWAFSIVMVFEANTLSHKILKQNILCYTELSYIWLFPKSGHGFPSYLVLNAYW